MPWEKSCPGNKIQMSRLVAKPLSHSYIKHKKMKVSKPSSSELTLQVEARLRVMKWPMKSLPVKK